MTAGQRWSTERPKVAGLWLWRRTKGDRWERQACQYEIVERSGELVGLGALEIPVTHDWWKDGEWCGPLAPPHDQEA